MTSCIQSAVKIVLKEKYLVRLTELHQRQYKFECGSVIYLSLLEHKQVICMRRKMLYYSELSRFIPEIFKFLKYSN